MSAKRTAIGTPMNAAMRQIEADNNQQLAGVLSAVDYNSENALGTREHKNAILRDLLEDFEPLDLRPSAIEVKEGQLPASASATPAASSSPQRIRRRRWPPAVRC